MIDREEPGHAISLADGRRIVLRPVRPDDEAMIAEAIRTASPQTLLHRFFTPLRGLAPEELRRLLTLDPAREFCIVGELSEPGQKRIVCGARYVRSADPEKAEIALTVHDDFQRLGIGRRLLTALIRRGQTDGIRTFVADVLATNTPMLRLLQSLVPKRRSTFAGGVSHVEFDLADVVLT
jgi:acetyltransferase